MTKIAIIGAGSGFGGRLSIDILSREPLRDATICLCDIHAGRLEKVRRYVQRAIDHHQLPAKLETTLDRTEALPGADFVVTSISVGGAAYSGYPFKHEIEIPRKYGIDQSVADTTTCGAVFRFLRTGPVHHQIIKDLERLCPEAYVLNHTNPMAMLTWLHRIDSPVKFTGLCHGVQGTSRRIAKWCGVEPNEISYLCAGINHLAWFLELRHNGTDLYPKLREAANDPEIFDNERVRFEIFKQFGYFSTESNPHDSEYLPYFRQTPELMEHFNLKSVEVTMEPTKVRPWMKDTGVDDDAAAEAPQLRLSLEYSTAIMEAVLTDVPFRFNGNVLNTGLITNLPEGCCVEVPCMADSRGIHPCHIGALPPHLAALDRSNIAVHELAVRAVLDKDPEAAFHACCVDPLTSAVLPLHKIREMFDELWEAEKDLLLYFDPSHTGPVPETCAE